MPKVDFDIKEGDAVSQLNDDDIVQQLGGLGYNVQGLTPDGMSVKMIGNDGQPYDAPITKVLDKLGYESTGAKPIAEGANYDTVSGELRAIVSKLPSDEMRKAAIEQTLQRRGMPQAQVMGSGRDWYFFDPESGQYKGLTNTPGWDRYDALEGALEIPRVVGSAVGAGLAGGATGGIGAMGGAAAGGALGDIITRGALSAYSDDYKHMAEENMGSMLKDVGMNAAIDAGTFGAAKYAGPVLGKVLGKPLGAAVDGVMSKGVVSPTLKAAGTVVEGVGGGVAKVARAAQTPFGRSMATNLIPGMAEAEYTGDLMKLGAQGLRGVPKGMEWLGGKLSEHAPNASAWLKNSAAGLSQSAGPAAVASERAAGAMALHGSEEVAHQATAPGIARELGKRTARVFGAGEKGVETAGKVGHVVGKGAEFAEDLGKVASTGARGVAGAGLGLVEGAARATQAAGKGARVLGTVMSPIESRAALQALGNEYVGRPMREAQDRLRRQRLKARMDTSNLVNN